MTVIHQSSAFTEGTNYTYDAAGNRVSRTDTFQPTSGSLTQTVTNYSYDAIYELTQAVVNGTAAESYTYDAVGNRLSSLGAPPYSYNNSNELTSIGKKTFSYDANGNTLTKTAPNGTTSYTWDFENRLTSVTLPKGSVLRYQYDPFGRRIFSDGTGRIFVYDGDNVIEDLDLSGKAVARYTQGLGIDEPLEETASGGSDYYEADGLGSISSLTDSTGSVANTYSYDSFGNQTASTGSVSNRFFFTGRESVAKTGLLYYRARYYDPTVGRFLSEDPSRFPGTVNLYRYALNNPADMVDPSGLAECFYRISTHTLQCTSDKNTFEPPIFVGPESVSSGLGACRDNPTCAQKLFRGPIPPGEYRMNRDLRPGHDGIYRLEPIPKVSWWQVDLGLKRGGFELHPGHRTLGCINVLKDDTNAMEQYNRMLSLLAGEDGQNYLLVGP